MDSRDLRQSIPYVLPLDRLPFLEGAQAARAQRDVSAVRGGPRPPGERSRVNKSLALLHDLPRHCFDERCACLLRTARQSEGLVQAGDAPGALPREHVCRLEARGEVCAGERLLRAVFVPEAFNQVSCRERAAPV